ncbi:MAG: sugar phosphate isomerase/epimerase [Ferruginibacter sp.]
MEIARETGGETSSCGKITYLLIYFFFSIFLINIFYSMMKYTRSKFLQLGGLGVTGTLFNSSAAHFINPSDNDFKLNFGLTSYTFRSFNLDDTIKMCLRLGITNISLKAMHMPLESSADELKKIAEKVRAAGMNLYGAGVIYMKTAKEVETIFTYAVNAGLKMIIGVPNHELLPLVNEKVKSTNIVLAIHNHGPGDKLYTSPSDVYEKVKNLDKRIGLCIDIGHVQRIGLDPSTMLEKYKDRLYDMHMKDVNKTDQVDLPIEIGRGMIDIPKVIRTLKKINYKGNMSFEFEKDGDDPLPGLAESVGYVHGVIRAI